MATRSWKYYRAKVEKIRKASVFPGPIDPEQDEFIHYHRDPAAGLDYFGVFTTRHLAWRAAQPTELALAEIDPTKIPSSNKHTSLAERRRLDALKSATTALAEARCEEAFTAELAAKGLPIPAIEVPIGS